MSFFSGCPTFLCFPLELDLTGGPCFLKKTCLLSSSFSSVLWTWTPNSVLVAFLFSFCGPTPGTGLSSTSIITHLLHFMSPLFFLCRATPLDLLSYLACFFFFVCFPFPGPHCAPFFCPFITVSLLLSNEPDSTYFWRLVPPFFPQSCTLKIPYVATTVKGYPPLPTTSSYITSRYKLLPRRPPFPWLNFFHNFSSPLLLHFLFCTYSYKNNPFGVFLFSVWVFPLTIEPLISFLSTWWFLVRGISLWSLLSCFFHPQPPPSNGPFSTPFVPPLLFRLLFLAQSVSYFPMRTTRRLPPPFSPQVLPDSLRLSQFFSPFLEIVLEEGVPTFFFLAPNAPLTLPRFP